MTGSSQRVVEYLDGIRQCVPSVLLLYTSVIQKESLKHSFLASSIKLAAAQASKLHQQSLQLFKPLDLSKTCAGTSVITHQTTTTVLRPLALSTTLITLSVVSGVLGMCSTSELGPCFLAKIQKLSRRSLLKLIPLSSGGIMALLARFTMLLHGFVPHLKDTSNFGTTKSLTPLLTKGLAK
jgi:hypothetical protein